jgi:hypothetical protein
MALVDIDRHILLELTILSEKMREAMDEFRLEWDEIQDVRIRTEVIVISNKDARNPELMKLKERIVRASQICNTKMCVIVDCMSRQAALLQHLVSMIEESHTGKGIESYAKQSR